MIMILQLLLGLGLLVTLHELGHFLFARLFGMRVEKFVIFLDIFDFKLFKFKKGETEYSIGWLPFGGYVKISGMIDESTDKEQLSEEPKPWEFRSKPAWQRVIVLAGGVIVNFLVAIFIFSALLLFGEGKYLPNESVTDGIYAYEPGKEIGLQNGDQIVSVNGTKLERFKDSQSAALSFGGEYEVNRDGKLLTVTIPDTIGPALFALFGPTNFEPVVSEVVEESAAAKMGIKPGDVIQSIDGNEVNAFGDIKNILVFTGVNDTIEIEVVSGGGYKKLSGVLDSTRMLGIAGVENYEQASYGVWSSFRFGFKETMQLLNANVKGLASLFKGESDVRKSVVGPVGIAKIYGSEFQAKKFWKITALISLILAITNLLPIPALDGGHILIILIESLIGRELPERAKMVFQVIGLVLLLGLILFSVVNDIINF